MAGRKKPKEARRVKRRTASRSKEKRKKKKAPEFAETAPEIPQPEEEKQEENEGSVYKFTIIRNYPSSTQFEIVGTRRGLLAEILAKLGLAKEVEIRR